MTLGLITMADKQNPPPPKEPPKQEPPKQEPTKQEPPKQEQASQDGQPKQQKPVKTQTAGETQGGKFSVLEMIDLALCSPEVGAVNFNILRLVLRDLVKKTGLAQTPVKVNDLEAHQVEVKKLVIL